MVYDKQAIIEDYKKGLSLHDLEDKYGISISYARDILTGAGVIRSISKAVMLSKSNQTEWRKLIRTGFVRKDGERSVCRIISIPAEILMQLELDLESNLKGKWLVKNKTLQLVVKESAS